VNETTTLYRPVGQQELDLISVGGYREFPPRLPHQPIFYPVLNEEYATQIARDWNTKSGSRRGFVTCFKVRTEFLRRYEIKTVGSSIHQAPSVGQRLQIILFMIFPPSSFFPQKDRSH
jgi:hypothetical protein